MKTRLVSALAFLLNSYSFGDASHCTSEWELFSSAPYEQTALPDTNVTYWRYRFELKSGEKIGLQLKGKFPYSRYMNFNIYDQKTMDSTGSLPDKLIVPNPGSSNPFWEGVQRDVEKRDYTVWFLPSGEKPPISPDRNTLSFPASREEGKVQLVELWYRVYLPDPTSDSNGSVTLPQLQAYDLNSGTPTACPKRKTTKTKLLLALDNLPPKGKNGEIAFYHPDGTGLYANKDNQYIASRLGASPLNVGVLRFRPASFPNTDQSNTAFDSKTEIRYWSMCMGGISQETSGCIADRKVKLDSDGMVTLVVGAESLRKEVEGKGLNFLARGKVSKLILPILIYRNLLTKDGFEGTFKKVPRWPAPEGVEDPTSLAAHHYISEYAPIGRECSNAQFKRELSENATSLCGISVR